MSDELLTIPQVQKILKISRTTVYKLIERGLITPIEKPSYLKKPAKVQFRKEDIIQLRENSVAA